MDAPVPAESGTGRDVSVRPYEPSDRDTVIGVWYRSCMAVYTFLPTERNRTLEDATGFFTTHLEPRCELWVAECDGRIAGYLAMGPTETASRYVDRLYVDPPMQRRGVGSALLAQALSGAPEHVDLHTHQENVGARAFYESAGFVAIEFGVSPPPESAPDVRYRWTPPPA